MGTLCLEDIDLPVWRIHIQNGDIMLYGANYSTRDETTKLMISYCCEQVSVWMASTPTSVCVMLAGRGRYVLKR